MKEMIEETTIVIEIENEETEIAVSVVDRDHLIIALQDANTKRIHIPRVETTERENEKTDTDKEEEKSVNGIETALREDVMMVRDHQDEIATYSTTGEEAEIEETGEIVVIEEIEQEEKTAMNLQLKRKVAETVLLQRSENLLRT